MTRRRPYYGYRPAKPGWSDRFTPLWELLTLLWIIGCGLFVAFFTTWTGS